MSWSRVRTTVVMLLIAVSPVMVGYPAVAEGTTKNILEAYREDIRYRLYGQEPANNRGWRVNAHEIEEGVVYTNERIKVEYDLKPPNWKRYHAAHHTSTLELGEIAAKAKPKLVVLYHILFWEASGQDLLDEIAEVYEGEVIVGRDLQVIE